MQCHNANVIDLLTKFTDILVIFVNGLSYTWTDLGWYVKHGGRQAPRCYTRSFLRKFYSVPSRFRISFLIVVPPPKFFVSAQSFMSPAAYACTHDILVLVYGIQIFNNGTLQSKQNVLDDSRRIT